MLFKKLAVASVISMAAAIETHGGIDFEVRWEAGGEPETKPIRDFYVNTGAEQAATRLYKRISERNFQTNCEVTGKTDAESLFALKECIAAEDENAFFSLLSEDLDEGDAFWEKVVKESTASRKDWIAARGWVRAYFDGSLTAPQFAAWMTSEDADKCYLRGNAEHYYKATENLSLLQQKSRIFEGWGGVLSSFGSKLIDFTVPDFQIRKFGTDEYPSEWAIDPSFGFLQRAGPKTLRSGTVWGILHIGVRDITAAESGNGKSGMEIYGAVWYPPWDQSSEENQAEFKKMLLDEGYQVLAEVVNFSLQANKDCAQEGKCRLPMAAIPGQGAPGSGKDEL
ncbi:unnamed protein product [Clonostachys chloroleuca]|uniref:Uncharacterized protein n=1 Tax=Clonostachys chloroleuca TaxID=1926264 RepID=A0AA35M7V6_9HYPO|nr:unnamed protein product [Clonostachys chloroleuca]